MLKRNIADGKIRALVAGRDLYEGRGAASARPDVAQSAGALQSCTGLQ
jgi:hypothetical protein